MISLRPDVQHMLRRRERFLTVPQHLKIEKLSHTALGPFQIVTCLHEKEAELIHYADVYNHQLSCNLHRFQKSTDPLLSTKLYAENSAKIRFLHFQALSFVVEVYTKVGFDVLDESRVEEMYVDSRFKINQNKLELFCGMLL